MASLPIYFFTQQVISKTLFNHSIGLHFDQVLVLAILVALVAFLVKGWVRPSTTFMAGAVILLFAGTLKPEQLLSGLANKQIAIIVLLVLISAGLRKHFDIRLLFDKLFAFAQTPRMFLVTMMASSSVLSAFINNTPMVAIMTPYVYDWGKRKGVAPSKLLIPLSFATMLGGMITVVGTSTNLVMNGFLEEMGEPLLTYTDFLFLGLLVTFTGIVFILFIGVRLLPENEDKVALFKAHSREYVVEAELSPGSPLSGLTVQQASLRQLEGLFLADIIRGDRVISPVGPTEKLLVRDKLIFAGDTDKVVELLKEDIGLLVPKPNGTFVDNRIRVIEAVIPANSSLAGSIVRDSDFRNRYDAAILAIHRNGERIRGKIGDARLQTGDLLLLTIGENFYERQQLYRDLFAVSEVKQVEKPSPVRSKLFLGILFTAVLLVIVGVVELFIALMVIFGAMIALKLFSAADLKRDLDFDLVAILVCALAIGNALIATGAAELISHSFLELLRPTGLVGLLTGLFLLTVLLTSFVTNAAAVSIGFPIAYSLAQELGMPGTPFYVAVAFAASCAFMTPVGYQTNLMVYGPGGYTFKDYFRIGFPLTLVFTAVCITFIVLRYL